MIRHKVTVVTFNYERSLEAYLWDAFRTRYRITNEQAAAELNAAVEFIHVYGKLGRLPTLNDGEAVPDLRFGRLENENDPLERAGIVIQAARSLHLMFRDIETKNAFQRAKERIEASEFICFLGFGFLEINLTRLRLGEIPQKHLFASALGLNKAKQMEIESRLSCKGRGAHHKIHFGNERGAQDYLKDTGFIDAATALGLKAAELHRRMGA